MRNTNNATPQNSSYGTHELRGALFDYGWRYECIGNFQETIVLMRNHMGRLPSGRASDCRL